MPPVKPSSAPKEVEFAVKPRAEKMDKHGLLTGENDSLVLSRIDDKLKSIKASHRPDCYLS